MASSPYDNWVSNPAEDHGPLMSITFWTLTGLAFVFLFVRLWIRHHQGKLWIDDLLLTISWFLLLAQGVLNQLAINLGFGKHVLDINFDNAESIAYYGASGLAVSICAITLSKISFGVTLLRLTEKWPRMWVYFAMASLAVCAIPLTVMPFVQCTPIAKTFVDLLPGKCINKNPSIYYARFQGGKFMICTYRTMTEMLI
ncbi:hypothetical protein N0V86_000524 [Didymella sp. IMI 355093]|nr:hypothetical protein N0V86_000524 [Didymella sp. IMI 355093]